MPEVVFRELADFEAQAVIAANLPWLAFQAFRSPGPKRRQRTTDLAQWTLMILTWNQDESFWF